MDMSNGWAHREHSHECVVRHGLDLGCFNDTNDDDRKPAAVMKIYRNIELEMHSNTEKFAAANIDKALLWRIKSIHNG